MMSVENAIITYQDLADREDRQGSPQLRDRFLLLAADAALSGGETSVAEGLRERLLEANPHHMIKPYPSFEEALQAPDFSSYIADLRSQYPPEEAARLLAEGLPPEARLGTAPGAGRESEPHSATPPLPDVAEWRSGAEFVQPAILQRHLPNEAPAQDSARRLAGKVPPLPPAGPPAQPKTEAAREKPAYTYQADQPVPAVKAQLPKQPHVDEEEGTSRLSWLVGSFLFLVVLIAGLAAAGYTLARPFLPF